MAPISQSGSTSQGFEGPISSVGLGLCSYPRAEVQLL